MPPVALPTRYRQLADRSRQQGGSECTGFALAAAVNYLVRRDETDDPDDGGTMAPSVSPRMMYEMAQVYDKEAYDEGSTLLGALLGWRRHGVARETLWPYHADDEYGTVHGQLTLARICDARARILQDFDSVDKADVETMKQLLSAGEVLYASAVMHEGWYRLFLPDEMVITQRADDEPKGGHAFVIVGYDERGFWIHNSWGAHWGDEGYGVLAYDDWEQNAQDLWAINGIEAHTPAVTHADFPTTERQQTTAAEMWRHVVVLDDDGSVISEGPYGANADGLGTWLYMFEQRTKDWDTRRLLVFADDGSLPLAVSVERLAPICRQLMEHEIYPIFLLWDVPWHGHLDDELERNLGVWSTEEDRTLVDVGIAELGPVDLSYLFYEYQVPTTMAVHMWRALDTRAKKATTATGGAALLAKKISTKFDEMDFELHVGAHGAGDFLLSELVGLLPDISTGELIAPATTMDTFARTYKPMLDWSRMQRLTVTALDDQSERADRVGGYNESILCLAANVLAVEAVDSDDRFNWGPLSGQHEVAMDQMDEWATETLRVEPEPILGMQRFLAQDPQIDALRTNGALGVEVVAGLSHKDLVTDTAVWTEVIGRLERPRTSRRPVHNPRVPFVTPWTREDPLARAQRELRERRQG